MPALRQACPRRWRGSRSRERRDDRGPERQKLGPKSQRQKALVAWLMAAVWRNDPLQCAIRGPCRVAFGRHADCNSPSRRVRAQRRDHRATEVIMSNTRSSRTPIGVAVAGLLLVGLVGCSSNPPPKMPAPSPRRASPGDGAAAGDAYPTTADGNPDPYRRCHPERLRDQSRQGLLRLRLREASGQGCRTPGRGGHLLHDADRLRASRSNSSVEPIRAARASTTWCSVSRARIK